MTSHTVGDVLPLAPDSTVRSFAATLLPEQRQALTLLRAQAREAVPAHCIAFCCGSELLGHLLPAHALELAAVLHNAALHDEALVWHAQQSSHVERSAQLQAALCQLRERGRIGGWRNEDFCFYLDREARPGPMQSAFVQIERAAFRYLGMMSHAVHINGFTSEGRMWCGQRSNSKATDPGLWDNMTAGGLSAGESLESCAVRELWEEAGLRDLDPSALLCAGRVRISRPTPAGWHDETLHVYNLQLPDEFVPSNQDGEVQAFACLSAAQVLAGIADGQWTSDAALAIAQGVLLNSEL